MILWTIEHGCRTDTPRVCDEAAAAGHLEVLKWARLQKPPCPWDSSTCHVAAREGKLEVLQCTRTQEPPCPWESSQMCNLAAEGAWASRDATVGEGAATTLSVELQDIRVGARTNCKV